MSSRENQHPGTPPSHPYPNPHRVPTPSQSSSDTDFDFPWDDPSVTTVDPLETESEPEHETMTLTSDEQPPSFAPLPFTPIGKQKNRRRDSFLIQGRRAAARKQLGLDFEDAIPEETETQANVSPVSVTTITLPGGTLTISPSKQVKDTPDRLKLWDKNQRKALDAKDKQTFEEKATKWVLAKSNKLQVLSYDPTDGNALKNLGRLRTQLEALKLHMERMDIDDVMTVVVPTDVNKSSAIHMTTYDIFTDYPQLTPEAVAVSSTWYKYYVTNEWIGENFLLTLDCLRNNTEEELFSKCLEEMNQYPPVSHGGPLMLMLLLARIQSSSEKTITSLIHQVKNLKISDIKGENVDEAVTLIRSAYEFMVACSTDHHDYVPDDFPKTVLRVFQTTSVPAFNSAFEEEEKDSEIKSFKTGGAIDYPTIEETLNLATNMYTNMRAIWNGTTGSSVFNASATSFVRTCDNCGSTDHLSPSCPKERDEARIAANKQKRMNRQGSRGGQGRGRGGHNGGRFGRGGHSGGRGSSGRGRGRGGRTGPKDRQQTRTEDGIPLIQNKFGHFVTDTKRLKEERARTQSSSQKQALITVIKEGVAAQLEEREKSATPPTANTASTGDSAAQRFNNALNALSLT